MKIGDTVRNIKTGEIGVVEWSTFGVSIHCRNSDGKLVKTLGEPISKVKKNWEVIESKEEKPLGD